MERMIQAGARPMTSLQYLLELQRDWARSETYDLTTGIAKKYGGAYGLGIIYAKTMFGASEGGHAQAAECTNRLRRMARTTAVRRPTLAKAPQEADHGEHT